MRDSSFWRLVAISAIATGLYVAAENATSGGGVLPDSAKEKVNRGIVLAIGDGSIDDKGSRIPIKVKPGDQVLFYGAPDKLPQGVGCGRFVRV